MAQLNIVCGNPPATPNYVDVVTDYRGYSSGAPVPRPTQPRLY